MENKTRQNKLKLFVIALKYTVAVSCLAVTLLFLIPTYVSAELEASYMYNLSDFTGDISYSWAGLSVDKERNEIYVIYQNVIDIFNDKGMKIYNFGYDQIFDGVMFDVAVTPDGKIYVISIVNDTYNVIRCNYRGEPISVVELRDFPSGLSDFSPTRILYWKDHLYLADLHESLQVVMMDLNGLFKDVYNVKALLGFDKLKGMPGHDKDIVGFSIDSEGHLLLTVPTVFKAFRISPDRSVQAFGDPGSIPGKFGVVSGIASDSDGYVYVVDTLRSVIIVFDKNFDFITEFGFRGERPGNLIAPKNIVANKGLIYVSQARKRGVSVYKIRKF
jgi:DNA-binding beta-propeller fold protein YncE